MMRMIFGVLSLLFVVAVIGFLAKKQLASVNEIKVPVIPGATPTLNVPASPGGNVQQQSQQIQQQFKAAAEAAMQPARPASDDQ
jgi:hypothetical protein